MRSAGASDLLRTAVPKRLGPVDNGGGRPRGGTTVTRVIEPARGEPARASRAVHAGSGAEALDGSGAGAAASVGAPESSAVEALADLVTTLERSGDEMLAAVPFLGDQATTASVNAYVDAVVAAIHALRADADDLRRVLAICEQATRGDL